MSRFLSRLHQGPGVTTLVLVLVGVISAAVLVFAVVSQQRPPRPGADAGHASDTTSTSRRQGLVLPYSVPAKLRIPSINVESELIEVGKATNGSLEVPSGPTYNNAAWYKNSPTPGQRGVSVIIGHVDSAQDGPSVFYELAAVRQSGEIYVTRDDGRTAVFLVKAVKEYDKDNFPSEMVYVGSENRPELRLITCGGGFSPSSGTYENNIVVYAVLDRTEPS